MSMDALAIVSRLYGATDEKDAKLLVDPLADDMRFEGPVMRSQGAAQYIAMNESSLPFHRETSSLRQFANANDVCSIDETDVATPQGGILTLTMADWIHVQAGRGVEQRISYDAREFAQALGM